MEYHIFATWIQQCISTCIYKLLVNRNLQNLTLGSFTSLAKMQLLVKEVPNQALYIVVLLNHARALINIKRLHLEQKVLDSSLPIWTIINPSP